MPLFEAIRLALSQLRVQKLKSAFTLLGVTIGVMFLIAVVAVVNGMNKYVEQDFAGKFLGVNTFNLRPKPDFTSGDVSEATWREWNHRPKINAEDAYAVREGLPPGVHWAIQNARWATPRSAYSRGGPQVMVEAVTADYFVIKDLHVTKGRLFDAEEDTYGAPVVVIGTAAGKQLFPNLEPVGRELKINGLPFTVIGVLEKQGSYFGLDLDRQIIGPFRSGLEHAMRTNEGLYGVVVQAPNQTALIDAEDRTRDVMRRRHKLHPGEPDNFVFETSGSALGDWAQLQQILYSGGVVLPAFGLIVGAIVIMNIMLVAVAERTREIGIRKSLGAKRRDILAQFLVESATLSLIGASIGIVLGVGLARAVALWSPLPAEIAPWSIGLAVAVGAGVGIVAGAYPASRAARLDPIVALRTE